MSENVSIMVFLLAAILLAITFFEKIRNWKYYKYLIMGLLVIYIPFGIWEIFIKKSDSDKSDESIISKVDTTGNIINSKIDANTLIINRRSDSNKGQIIKAIPKNNRLLKSKEDISQSNKNGDNEINTNKGANYGTIGGKDNTVNNQFGLKPRDVSESFILSIEKQVPDKSTPISVYRRSEDAESFNYATKIVLALNKAGYTNSFVNGIIHDQIIGGDPEEAAKQQATIRYFLEDGQFNIAIPSNQ